MSNLLFEDGLKGLEWRGGGLEQPRGAVERQEEGVGCAVCLNQLPTMSVIITSYKYELKKIRENQGCRV